MYEPNTTIISFPELGWGPWELNRFVFKDLFGSLSVAWYGAIICLAMILACALILRLAVKKEGFVLDSFLDYFIFAIPAGVVGARCMYVLARLEEYDSFLDMIAIWNGGLAIYGGVLAGALAIFVLAKIKKHSFFKVVDAVIPGLMLAQAMGRWGNFINGEAHGGETSLPWGMTIKVIDSVGAIVKSEASPVHPTFLYESLLTFTGFLIALFLIYRFKKVNGQVFCFYLVWYGIGRMLIEGLRTDSLYIGSFRLAQCIGLATALAGIALFVYLTFFLSKKPFPAAEAKEAAIGDEVQAEKTEAAEETEKTKITEEKEEKNGNSD